MSSRIATNKKGSYIIEAVLTLPIFLIASIVIISIISMYACIEESNYVLANEMRREALQSNFVDGSFFFAGRTINKICDKNSLIDRLTINDYLYKEDYMQADQVIFLDLDLKMHANNPLSLAADGNYNLSLMTRAYVGRERDADPMSDEEMSGDDSEPVFVFPHMGKKYHGKNCTFVRAAYITAPLTAAVKSKYGSCSVCHSGVTPLGTAICYFPEYGDAYHLKGCPVLSRKYIEMERKTAEERGYTPCSKCGGH